MADKGMDVSGLLHGAAETGLCGALDIGILPDDTERRTELTAEFPWIRHSAGIYPGASGMQEKEDDTSAGGIEALLSLLEKRLRTGLFSAVGEMGIDLHWNYATPEIQADLFCRQIELANSYRLPVIIHSRKADREVLRVLRRCRPEYGGIMHCFSSGYETAKSCINAGLYVSFAGNCTYKNAEEIQNAARNVPLDMMLVETDAPYLSPQPVRGKKNHPGFIKHTYTFLAGLRSMEFEVLMERVTENYFRLFPTG